MTRSELISQLASAYPHLYHRDIERVVEILLNEVCDALSEGRRVEIRGFGSFSIRKREPRVARNPKTGESVSVNERHSIYFRMGKELQERINQ